MSDKETIEHHQPKKTKEASDSEKYKERSDTEQSHAEKRDGEKLLQTEHNEKPKEQSDSRVGAIELKKNEGNELFKRQEYSKAIETYQMVRTCRTASAASHNYSGRAICERPVQGGGERRREARGPAATSAHAACCN